MSRTAFLLRGINVGGRHPLPMARLREVAARLGHEDVATYVQSGNLVSVAPGVEPADAAATLAAALERDLGHAVPVVARTHAELQAVVARDPFGDRAPPRGMDHPQPADGRAPAGPDGLSDAGGARRPSGQRRGPPSSSGRPGGPAPPQPPGHPAIRRGPGPRRSG